ncbi:MAG: 5-formyltetrahydrofolate cyclo-ligase, partial [Planctomycetota bacterium]
RQGLEGISPGQKREMSQKIAGQVAELEEFRAADPIFLYVAIGQEVETLPIAEAALAAGKTILAPRVDWQRREMDAVACESIAEGLARGRYGLLEPAEGEIVAPEKIELILVPGLAFDRRGRRLGQGGGFYDRFLAQTGCRAWRVGVAFSMQLAEQIPAEPHDQGLDLLITETETLRFQRQSSPAEKPAKAQEQ